MKYFINLYPPEEWSNNIGPNSFYSESLELANKYQKASGSRLAVLVVENNKLISVYLDKPVTKIEQVEIKL